MCDRLKLLGVICAVGMTGLYASWPATGSEPADDPPVVGWFLGLSQDQVLTGEGGTIVPHEYGVTDYLLSCYNTTAEVGPTKWARIRYMCDLAGDANVWIVVHWAGGCICSANKCEHPNYDPLAGTMRDFMRWADLPDDKFRPYIDSAGVVYDATPCPTWYEHWDWQTTRLRYLSILSRTVPNIVGIAIDAELYRSNRCNERPHIPRYTSACYCKYCVELGVDRQFEYIRQLAKRMRQATNLKIGLFNADGLTTGTETPVPIYAAMSAELRPWVFSEYYYTRGFLEQSGARLDFGTWQDIWTNGGEWDVRFVIGMYINRLYAVAWDRRHVDALPGRHEVLRQQMHAATRYTDGVWIYWPPYAVPLDTDYNPGDCRCHNGDCAGVEVSVKTVLDAIDQVNDPMPGTWCEYETLTDGRYAVRVIESDGRTRRAMVPKNAPCLPAMMVGGDDCR